MSCDYLNHKEVVIRVYCETSCETLHWESFHNADAMETKGSAVKAYIIYSSIAKTKKIYFNVIFF